jgi:hypothetical protein
MNARHLLTAAMLSLYPLFTVGCGGGGSGGRPATIVSGNVRSVSSGTARRGLEELWRLVRAWTVAEAVAQVTGIDSQGDLLQVLSGELVAFRVRLQSSTVLVDQDGVPLSCGDLSTGPTAQVQGTVDSSGDVEAAQIQVSPATNAAPTPVAVEGTVASLDCPTDLTVARNTGGDVVVNLNSTTQIRDPDGTSLACGNLASGDAVRVQGTQTSFGIDASTVERLSPAPAPTPTAPG